MPEYLLFQEYPNLAETIPRLNLGLWPTPLEPLENLSAYLGGAMIYIKRDDRSHNRYGGNKVRKLELVLAEAKKRGSHEIITAGGLGSHHVLATAALGREENFKVHGLFFCQPVTEQVKNNLLLDHKYGTEMHFARDYFGLVNCYLRLFISRSLAGKKPMLLMPGGSNDLSTIGYLNCLLEISSQLKEAGPAEPSAIFCAAGTGGTAAGLLAGIALCNLDTNLHAVRVVRPEILPSSRIIGLASGALSYLKKGGLQNAGRETRHLEDKLYLEQDYLGPGYGFSTEKAAEAISLFQELEGIELEECYTAKAATALIDYCRNEKKNNKGPVIFINSASSTHKQDLDRLPKPEELPDVFQWCFGDEARNCRCGLKKQNMAFCMTIKKPGWRWPA